MKKDVSVQVSAQVLTRAQTTQHEQIQEADQCSSDPHDSDQLFSSRVHHGGSSMETWMSTLGGRLVKRLVKKDNGKQVLENASDQEAEGQGQGEYEAEGGDKDDVDFVIESDYEQEADDIAAETCMDPTKIWDSLNVPNRPYEELRASGSEFEDVSNELCSLEGSDEKYIDQWRVNPDWSFAGMSAQLRIDANIDASKWQFYRARHAAKGMIDGAVKEQYFKLREYAAEMYPVDYALVEVETKDTWGWFLDQLAPDLELNNSFAFVQNLKLNIEGWGAAKATTEQDNLNSSRQANNHYAGDDHKLPDDNISEEKDRSRVMKLGQRFVEKVKQKSVYYYSEYNGNSTYQVMAHGDEQFVVDINDRTCGCNKWQLIGIPCVHGMAALLSTNHNPMDFIHIRYKKEGFLWAYTPVIYGINEPKMKQRGKPKKMRTLQSNEVRIGNTTKLRRNYVVVRCRKCGNEGHNRVTCERKGGGTDSVRGSQADEGGSESVGGSQADEGSQLIGGSQFVLGLQVEL
ncbi:hypothetical protein Ddye_015582 [Dipteronia dyeriana]|uniref:SWIM-type domain-containing protein n=1 Tax=Dipteronia dyeriana TaxID=168575 RepID=A0AAD9WZA2_9ROSI|nr:hypothetical protein Ddye_015582 [Dipteronia dyeriana]